MKKLKKTICSILTTAILVSAMPAVNVFAAGEVAINKTNFPCKEFRDFISSHFDSNSDGSLSSSEIVKAKELVIGDFVSYPDNPYFRDSEGYYKHNAVHSLKGIEYLTSLEIVDVYVYKWNHADGCNELQKNFDFSALKNLKELYFAGDADSFVLDNPKLERLSLSSAIYATDLSKLTGLKELEINTLDERTVNIPNLPNLEHLYLNDFKGKLNIANYSSVKKLTLKNDSSDGFELSKINKFTNLKEIFFDDYGYNKSLNLSINNMPYLEKVKIDRNEFLNIDLSNNPALNTVDINDWSFYYDSNDKIVLSHYCNNLNVSACPKLEKLFFHSREADSVNASNCPSLTYACMENVIKLDIQNSTHMVDAFYGDYSQQDTWHQDIDGIKYLGINHRYWDIESGATLDLRQMQPYSIKTEVTAGNNPIVIKKVYANPEGTRGFVTRLYTETLGRPADGAGVNSWVTAINDGASGAQAAKGFFFSDEFVSQNTSNAEYVTRLYKTFMDREPDAGGLKAWSDALNQGATREKVFDGFINSTEWANTCAVYGITSGGQASPTVKVLPAPRVYPSDEVLAFAIRLYTTCLGRPADPDGLFAWADALANKEGSGAKVAYGFFFSTEFISHNYDNGEFVRRCYLTFMDREPDAGGYKAWVDALDQGASREQVFNGFVKSPEFVALCEKAGIIAFD